MSNPSHPSASHINEMARKHYPKNNVPIKPQTVQVAAPQEVTNAKP